MVELIVMGLALYFGIGIVIGLIFVVFLASRLDHAARGASIFFRPMIFLGCVTLWPILLLRILSFKTINKPTEETS